jgi:hypothetical protein
MSIDATILGVERDGADVLLTLGPRIDGREKLTTAGQPVLRIVNATWAPDVGMDIWGGSSECQVIAEPGRRTVGNNAVGPWYERHGYTTLREGADFRRDWPRE